DPSKAAASIAEIPAMTKKVRKEIENGRKKEKASAKSTKDETGSTQTNSSAPTDSTNALSISPALAQRTAAAATDIRNSLKAWAAFYEGSVPEFSWWMKKPNDSAIAAINDYIKFLREDIAGLKGKDEDPLVGDPIGGTALSEDIASEWLAYSAEEMLAIGE